MKPSVLAGIFLVYFAIGLMASELGYTTPVLSDVTNVPSAPDGGGSFWENLSAALAPISWAFNAIAGVFQMATFQADGMPTLVNGLVFVPIGFLVLLQVVRLIRGGG